MSTKKVALVTGASSGIAKAIAEQLLDEVTHSLLESNLFRIPL